MRDIEIRINDNKTCEVVTPQPLVEGENRTTQIKLIGTPTSWTDFAVMCLLTTPAGVLVDAVPLPCELLNSMLDAAGTLKAEFIATRVGTDTEVDRTKNAALMPVSAARNPLGDIPPEPLPDLIADVTAAGVAANQAAALIEGVPAAEAAREAAEIIRQATRVIGTLNKKYRIVACVLRNEGSGWYAITDSDHQPVGISAVMSDTNSIALTYDFTPTKVGTLVCCPDEYYSEYGYSFGASVGLVTSLIKIAQNRTIGGYIYYSGTAWIIGAGSVGIVSLSFSGGSLKITHENIGTTYARTAIVRDGGCLANLGTVAADYSRVEFRDFAGALISAANTSMKIYFMATTGPAKNPNEVISVGGNVWVFGIFEAD